MAIEQSRDYEPAKIFNTHQSDLGVRLNTFTNYLLVVDGGVLSITIGAFLSGKPPAFAPDSLVLLRDGWWLLTAGLILALTSAFGVLIAQALVQAKMRTLYSSGDHKELQLLTGPIWLRKVIWSLVVLAFVASIAGLGFVSWAASAMLRVP